MQTSSILALALAICGTAIAVPAASPSQIPEAASIKLASNTPNCTALVDYCKCTDGDFDCETNPSCEWCEENVWDNPPAPSKK
ncbi:hypothetical protein GGR53DRAFT_462667 [Hypoxylon sp. FL1150]|nr:hypothetical protein GGR53DRAFT_462667 [Hypoxylon sp. FL1150]